jgi:hypothetical protein
VGLFGDRTRTAKNGYETGILGVREAAKAYGSGWAACQRFSAAGRGLGTRPAAEQAGVISDAARQAVASV